MIHTYNNRQQLSAEQQTAATNAAAALGPATEVIPPRDKTKSDEIDDVKAKGSVGGAVLAATDGASIIPRGQFAARAEQKGPRVLPLGASGEKALAVHSLLQRQHQQEEQTKG